MSVKSEHGKDVTDEAITCEWIILCVFAWGRVISSIYIFVTLPFVVMLRYVVFVFQTSSLVASEIVKHQSPSARATAIEKWAAVAEVCRNLHNFNSVLEITSAFMSSSIYRLKKTWEKVSKQVSDQLY